MTGLDGFLANQYVKELEKEEFPPFKDTKLVLRFNPTKYLSNIFDKKIYCFNTYIQLIDYHHLIY